MAHDAPDGLRRFAALLRAGPVESARNCFWGVYGALEPKSAALASFLTAQRAVLEANQVSQEDAKELRPPVFCSAHRLGVM